MTTRQAADIASFQFRIPSVGDKIELTEDWEFPLYLEHRNRLAQRIQPTARWAYGGSDNSILAIIETGSVLRVARIYIRQGKSEWDSITFTVVSAPKDVDRAKITARNLLDDSINPVEQKYKGARFWAKLADVNEIKYRPVEK